MNAAADREQVIKRLKSGWYKRHPDKFAIDAFDIELRPWQIEAARVFYAGKKPVVVARHHGAGGTFLSATLAYMTLLLFQPAKVVVVLPSLAAYRQIFLRELKFLHKRCIFADLFRLTKGRLYNPPLENELFAIWMSMTPQGMEGWLAPEPKRLFWIIEGAGGLREDCSEILTGSLEDSYSCLMHGIPGKKSTPFHRAFTSRKWHAIQVSAANSHLASPKLMRQWGEVWGEESAEYKRRVLAQFIDPKKGRS